MNKLTGQCNNTYHNSIGKKSNNSDYSALNEKIEMNLKVPKFKANDRVRITKYENIFSRGYTENWSREVFIINSVLKSNPWIYKIRDFYFDHARYIITREFKKLTVENFTSRLKQGNLVSKIDFDNKLISFYRKITSNKTKYLKVQKKLNSLTTKDYNFFLGRMYFRSNDGSQNMFFLSTNT